MINFYLVNFCHIIFILIDSLFVILFEPYVKMLFVSKIVFIWVINALRILFSFYFGRTNSLYMNPWPSGYVLCFHREGRGFESHAGWSGL